MQPSRRLICLARELISELRSLQGLRQVRLPPYFTMALIRQSHVSGPEAVQSQRKVCLLYLMPKSRVIGSGQGASVEVLAPEDPRGVRAIKTYLPTTLRPGCACKPRS